MIETRQIDAAHKRDINLTNEPFALTGRMVPAYRDKAWSYTVEPFAPEDVGEMCFPDEDYDYDALSRDHVFIGAYDGETCVGLAVLAPPLGLAGVCLMPLFAGVLSAVLSLVLVLTIKNKSV